MSGGGGGGGAETPALVPTETLPEQQEVLGDTSAPASGVAPAVATDQGPRVVTIQDTQGSQAGSARESLPLTGLDVLLLTLGGAMLLGLGLGVRSLSRSLA